MYPSASYKQALEKLSRTRQKSQLAQVTFSTDYIAGVVFAISASPEIPMPQEWFALTFSTQPERASQQLLNEYCDDLIELFKAQAIDIQNRHIWHPPHTHDEPALTRDSTLAHWCRGFLFAHKHLEAQWRRGWHLVSQKEPAKVVEFDRTLTRVLKLASTLADFEFALQQRQAPQRQQLTASRHQLIASLASCLREYIVIAESLSMVLPEIREFETQESGKSSE